VVLGPVRAVGVQRVGAVAQLDVLGVRVGQPGERHQQRFLPRPQVLGQRVQGPTQHLGVPDGELTGGQRRRDQPVAVQPPGQPDGAGGLGPAAPGAGVHPGGAVTDPSTAYAWQCSTTAGRAAIADSNTARIPSSTSTCPAASPDTAASATARTAACAANTSSPGADGTGSSNTPTTPTSHHIHSN